MCHTELMLWETEKKAFKMSQVCGVERLLLSLISGTAQSQTFKTKQPWQNYELSDTFSLEAISSFKQIENK